MLRDILLDWILFSLLEGFIFSYFILGTRIIKRCVLKYILYLGVISLINAAMYILLNRIPIPLINQLYLFVIFTTSSKVLFNISIKTSIVKMAVIYGVMFIVDAVGYSIVNDILGIELYGNSIKIFIGLLPFKIFEILFSIKGCDYMKATFGSIERR